MKLPFTYVETLREMEWSEPRSYLLSDFWRRPNTWPKGDREAVFLGNALQRVGQLKFRESWTGKELNAERRVSVPSFAATLEFYWDKVRGTFPTGTFAPSLLASWEGPVPPPFAASPPTTLNERKAQYLVRSRRLTQEGAELRLAYDHHAAQQQARKEENKAALERLRWVIGWIASAGRLGDLETLLRRVETERGFGHYIPAPKGFWNVETPMWSRFHKGHVIISIDERKPKTFYTYLTESSLSRATSEIPLTGDASDEELHLSFYMKMIIDAIRALKVTRDNQPDISEFILHFENNWPSGVDYTPTMAHRMATIARDPDSGKGAHKPTRKKRVST